MIKNQLKLSDYDLSVLLRMKSLREYRSIEIILKNNDFISIQNKESLLDRKRYLKIKYNL